MMITIEVLRAACPERTAVQLTPWIAPLEKACAMFEIDRPRRVAAFLAQMAHESGLTPGREENLNYSAKRLPQVWKRFAVNPGAPPAERRPNALALACAGNPEKLANVVYANRLGNGPPESGDGWKFRGRGPLQLTGRSNWAAFAIDPRINLSVNDALEYGDTLEGGIMTAAWFWETNDINRLADTPGVADETRRINGGEIGLADRKARFDRTVAALLAQG